MSGLEDNLAALDPTVRDLPRGNRVFHFPAKIRGATSYLKASIRTLRAHRQLFCSYILKLHKCVAVPLPSFLEGLDNNTTYICHTTLWPRFYWTILWTLAITMESRVPRPMRWEQPLGCIISPKVPLSLIGLLRIADSNRKLCRSCAVKPPAIPYQIWNERMHRISGECAATAKTEVAYVLRGGGARSRQNLNCKKKKKKRHNQHDGTWLTFSLSLTLLRLVH